MVGGVWSIDLAPARPGCLGGGFLEGGCLDGGCLEGGCLDGGCLEAASLEAASLEEAPPEATRAGGGRTLIRGRVYSLTGIAEWAPPFPKLKKIALYKATSPRGRFAAAVNERRLTRTLELHLGAKNRLCRRCMLELH